MVAALTLEKHQKFDEAEQACHETFVRCLRSDDQRPNREHGEDDAQGDQLRDCPRNCKRRGVQQTPLGNREGVASRFSRKPGDLPDEYVDLNTSRRVIMTATTRTRTISIPQRISVGLISMFFGVFLVYGVGIAQDSRLHNAAHDTRHSLGFPCH
jgi:cobalt transporter subunit CbtB